ncbi:unnamed protein product [Arctogadus glacialis]
MMATLTETEMKKISKLQRCEAVPRLAGHFTWPEFGDKRWPSVLRQFHQHFVFDMALFTVTRGFPWRDVIRAATMAKDVFPRLNGLDIPALLALLDEAQTQRLPDLSLLHGSQLSWYLTDACVGSHRLLAAVVDHATNVSTERAHLAVQVPPRPLPLTQGLTLEEVELQRRQAELTAALGCTEHQLQALRTAPRVSRRTEVNTAALLDAEGVQELVRSMAEQVATSLRQEATLVAKLLELKLQCTVLFTRGSSSPALTPHAIAKPTRPAQVRKGRRK